jgi:transcriptional repressor NrdR
VRCPFCGILENKVIDSRLSGAGEVTRRRRECEGCSRRYTTYERVEQSMPLILKKDGRRQPFDPDKLLAGLQRSCAKRNVSADTLERVVSEVQRALVELGQKEVDASFIGLTSLEHLRTIDQVAYVRFASVYREFQDVHKFIDVLRGLVGEDELAEAAEPEK